MPAAVGRALRVSVATAKGPTALRALVALTAVAMRDPAPVVTRVAPAPDLLPLKLTRAEDVPCRAERSKFPRPVTLAVETFWRFARLEGVFPDTVALDLAARLERSALEVTLAIGNSCNGDRKPSTGTQETILSGENVTNAVGLPIASGNQGADGHDAAGYGDVSFCPTNSYVAGCRCGWNEEGVGI